MSKPKLDPEDFSEEDTMKPLSSPDSHHLSAAQGLLELGNLEKATEELESITPELRGHPDVLQVRCKIYCQAGKWDYAAEVANALSNFLPDHPFGPLHMAYAR